MCLGVSSEGNGAEVCLGLEEIPPGDQLCGNQGLIWSQGQ